MDKITSKETTAGTVSDTNSIAELKAGFDNTPESEFINVPDNSNNCQEILVCYNVPAYLTFESNLTNIKTTDSPPVDITAEYPTIDYTAEYVLTIEHEYSIVISSN